MESWFQKTKRHLRRFTHNKPHSFENRLRRKSAIYFKRMHSILHLQRVFVPLLSETDCLATKKLQSNALIMKTSFFLIIIFCFQKVGLNLFFWEQIKFSKILFQIIQPVFSRSIWCHVFQNYAKGRKRRAYTCVRFKHHFGYIYIYIYITYSMERCPS